METSVMLHEYVTSWSFNCDSKLKTFVISQYSRIIYFIVFLNDFIHLLLRFQTHCLLFLIVYD